MRYVLWDWESYRAGSRPNVTIVVDFFNTSTEGKNSNMLLVWWIRTIDVRRSYLGHKSELRQQSRLKFEFWYHPSMTYRAEVIASYESCLSRIIQPGFLILLDTLFGYIFPMKSLNLPHFQKFHGNEPDVSIWNCKDFKSKASLIHESCGSFVV